MNTIEDVPWERRGLDILLANHPFAIITRLDNQDGPFVHGPWVEIDIKLNDNKKKVAIWKETGAVYEIDQLGAAADDPFLVPEGSPYDGSVASPT